MKAFSIKQPWANLIASGEKTIETRDWRTSYRGSLLIVSAKRPDIPPAGFALCVVDVVDCRPMIREDEPAARCPWRPKAWAWVLTNVRRAKPFAVRGRLGFYEVNLKHEADSDCSVDPGTGCCLLCGVGHDGPPCDCGGVAFHLVSCVSLLEVRS